MKVEWRQAPNGRSFSWFPETKWGIHITQLTGHSGWFMFAQHLGIDHHKLKAKSPDAARREAMKLALDTLVERIQTYDKIADAIEETGVT